MRNMLVAQGLFIAFFAIGAVLCFINGDVAAGIGVTLAGLWCIDSFNLRYQTWRQKK